MLVKKYLWTAYRAHLRTTAKVLSTQFLSPPLATFATKATTNENFLSGTSSIYAEQMYDNWKKDPNSVHASWRAYFQNLESGAETPFEQAPNVGQDPTVTMILNMLKQNGFS